MGRIREFFSSWAARIGAAIVCLIVLMAITAPVISPCDPLEMDESARLVKPNAEHIMGTDEYGRDIFSRIVYGARTSIMIGVCSVLMAAVIGVNIGLIAGYTSRVFDAISMRLMDAVIAFPATLLAVVIIAIAGTGSMSAMLAIAIVNIPAFARLTRSTILSEKNKLYVESEKAIGAGAVRILYREMLPNILSTLFVQITVSIANAILLESALSFLGLGTPPPAPSWGAMLSTGKNFILYSPTYVVFPGLVLTLLIIGLYLLGDALRDFFDPHSKERD